MAARELQSISLALWSHSKCGIQVCTKADQYQVAELTENWVAHV